jgi:ABC-2 type transport system ATP-binding protein
MVMSTLNMGTSVQYRVVGDLSNTTSAIQAEPNLEDGYVWQMHQQPIHLLTNSL